MVTWRLVYTAQARKDAKKIQAAGLREKAEALLNLIAKDPYATPDQSFPEGYLMSILAYDTKVKSKYSEDYYMKPDPE